MNLKQLGGNSTIIITAPDQIKRFYVNELRMYNASINFDIIKGAILPIVS